MADGFIASVGLFIVIIASSSFTLVANGVATGLFFGNLKLVNTACGTFDGLDVVGY